MEAEKDGYETGQPFTGSMPTRLMRLRRIAEVNYDRLRSDQKTATSITTIVTDAVAEQAIEEIQKKLAAPDVSLEDRRAMEARCRELKSPRFKLDPVDMAGRLAACLAHMAWAEAEAEFSVFDRLEAKAAERAAATPERSRIVQVS